MAKNIKGITVEIGGETTGLQKALKDVNEKSRNLSKELSDVNRLLKFDPKNPELLAQKQKLLNEQVETTSEKLNKMKEAQKQVQEQFDKGEITEEQYRKFQRELIATENKLDYFKDQLSDSQKKVSKFGENMKAQGGKMKAFGGGLQNAGKTITTHFTAPLLGAIGAIGALAVKAGEFADGMLDLQSITGISTDSLQAFERIEHRAGMGAGTLANTMTTLNKKFADGELESKKAKVAIEKMGYSFQDFVDLPAEEKMDALMSQMQGMERQDRIELASMLGITDMLPALDVANTEWSSFKKEMSESAISEDNLNSMATFSNGMSEMKQQMKTALFEALVPLIERFNEMRPALEEKLVPAMEKLGGFISDIINWFMDLDDKTKIIIAVMVALVPVIGTILMVLGVLISILGSLTTVLGAFGVTMSAVALPILAVIAVVIALIAIGVLLWKNWDTIKEKASELWTKVKEMFSKMWESVKEYMGNLWEDIKDIWGKVMEFFTSIDLKQIGKDIIQGLIDGIKEMAGKVVESAKEIATGIGEKIKGILKLGSPSKLMMEMGQFTGEGLAIGIKNSMNQVKDVASQLGQMAIPQNLDSKQLNAKNDATPTGKNMIVNIHSPKALDVRDASKEFNRTLNKMSLMW